MLKVTGRRRVSKMQVSGSAPIYPSKTNVAQPHYRNVKGHSIGKRAILPLPLSLAWE